MHDFVKAEAPKSRIRTRIWKNSAINWKYLERAHDFQAGSPLKSCINSRYTCLSTVNNEKPIYRQTPSILEKYQYGAIYL